MLGNQSQVLSRTPAWLGRFGICIAWVLGMGTLGCSDHRIGLRTFLIMQQQYEAEAAERAAAKQPASSQPAVDKAIDRAMGPYRLGQGDVIAVTLTMIDELGLVAPVQVRVDRSGTVELPLAGKVNVDDMELEDAERAIRKAYVPKYYQETAVHVALVTAEATDVLVVGSVTLPGLIKLRRTERDMLRAIVLAGGVTETASGTATLKRIRRPQETVTLSLTDPEQLKAALALDPLEDGDIVTVHAAAPNTIFMGGLVMAPGPQPYPPGVGMTALQALAAAGGPRLDLLPHEATLIRKMPDGKEVHVKLDVNRLTKGKDPNFRMASGDILWLPHTFETRMQEWINRNIFFRAGVSANVTYNVTGVEYMNRRGGQTGGGGGGGNLEDRFDPFGFLNQNTALQNIQAAQP